MKKNQITIDVKLDENQIPEAISWSAPDGGIENEAAQAFFLYTWNETTKETFRLDLWTKEMPIESMQYFFYQMLNTMAESYERATSQSDTANAIADFAKQFKILSEKES